MLRYGVTTRLMPSAAQSAPGTVGNKLQADCAAGFAVENAAALHQPMIASAASSSMAQATCWVRDRLIRLRSSIRTPNHSPFAAKPAASIKSRIEPMVRIKGTNIIKCGSLPEIVQSRFPIQFDILSPAVVSCVCSSLDHSLEQSVVHPFGAERHADPSNLFVAFPIARAAIQSQIAKAAPLRTQRANNAVAREGREAMLSTLASHITGCAAAAFWTTPRGQNPGRASASHSSAASLANSSKKNRRFGRRSDPSRIGPEERMIWGPGWKGQLKPRPAASPGLVGLFGSGTQKKTFSATGVRGYSVFVQRRARRSNASFPVFPQRRLFCDIIRYRRGEALSLHSVNHGG